MNKYTTTKFYLKLIIKLCHRYYLIDLKVYQIIVVFYFVASITNDTRNNKIIKYKIFSYDLENINTYDNCVIKYKLYLKHNPFTKQNSF